MGFRQFSPSADAPVGYTYTPEGRAVLRLFAAFWSDEIDGVPLSFPLLAVFHQQLLEGWAKDSGLLSASSCFWQFGRGMFRPLLRCLGGAQAGLLRSIPRGGILVRIEAAEMKKQWDLISRVLPHLEGLPVWLLCGEKEVPTHCIASGVPALSEDAISEGVIAGFVTAYFPRVIRWNLILRRELSASGLPPRSGFRLAAAAAESLLAGVQARALLRETRPRMIVVDCDHHAMSAWLVFFAKRLRIPTVTLQHGTPADLLFFFPLWADYALLWGEAHARAYADFGASRDRLRIVGCPRVDAIVVSSEPSLLKATLGIPATDRVVMLATDRGLQSDRLRLVRTALDGVRSCPGHTLLIKCHPAEDSAFYHAAFGTEEGVKIMSDEDLGLSAALAVSDVVLAQWSGVAADAMLMTKPVILVDLGLGLMSNQAILDNGACLAVRDSSGLAAALRDESYTSRRNPLLHESAKAYVRSYYAACGEEAARGTAASLRELWQLACLRGLHPGEAPH